MAEVSRRARCQRPKFSRLRTAPRGAPGFVRPDPADGRSSRSPPGRAGAEHLRRTVTVTSCGPGAAARAGPGWRMDSGARPGGGPSPAGGGLQLTNRSTCRACYPPAASDPRLRRWAGSTMDKGLDGDHTCKPTEGATGQAIGFRRGTGALSERTPVDLGSPHCGLFAPAACRAGITSGQVAVFSGRGHDNNAQSLFGTLWRPGTSPQA